MIDFSKYPSDKGVIILTTVKNEFEELYLEVREKEKRIYPDEEVIKLPYTSSSNPHKKEWELRTKSYLRYEKYLRTKNNKLNFLDLGCGNGWFTGRLSKTFNHNYYCIDVNLKELKQGVRLFSYSNLNFIYADIFEAELPDSSFDIITINSVIQYFRDLKSLINRLFTFIKKGGEIHLIDSPLYSELEAINAEFRSLKYYTSTGNPEMAEKYFHHTFDELSSFSYEILFNPLTLKNKVFRLLNINESPFPWIRIRK